jgi:hypothetical protein
MKCHIVMVILVIGWVNGFKVLGKLKNRHKTASNGKSAFRVKKDGPITWDLLTDQKALANLINGEQKNNVIPVQPSMQSIQPVQPIANNSINSAMNGPIPIPNYSPIVTAVSPVTQPPQGTVLNAVLDDNHKSKTFRTVGPLDNSTVNSNGQKYSQLFNFNANRSISIGSGFYGQSRLTR